jgi:hypothetical protein
MESVRLQRTLPNEGGTGVPPVSRGMQADRSLTRAALIGPSLPLRALIVFPRCRSGSDWFLVRGQSSQFVYHQITPQAFTKTPRRMRLRIGQVTRRPAATARSTISGIMKSRLKR